MSTAELRVRSGGWFGTDGRKSNKRVRKFWLLLTPDANSQAPGRRVKVAANSPRRGISGAERSGGAKRSVGLFVHMGKVFAWIVCTLLALTFLGAISLGMIHGYRALTSSGHFAVSGVEITGNRQISYPELLSLSGIAIGDSILEVNLGEINSRLLKSPWVESATVRRILPGGVSLHVVEREPFFWIQQAGVLYYADRFGNPFAPLELGRFVSLPALIVEDEAQLNRAVLQEWMRAVERMEYPFGFSEVAWIKVEEANIVRVYLEDRGMEVTMDLSAWREHGGLMNQVWNDLRARGELDRVGRLTVMSGKVWVQAKQP